MDFRNPPKDTDGRREGSGRGWVRELQGRWCKAAALHARPPPRSTPTIGRPSRSGTSRAVTRSQSWTVSNTSLSSPLGRLRRYVWNLALSLLSTRASSRSSRITFRVCASSPINGLALRMVDHLSHVSTSPWNSCTWTLPLVPSAIKSHHQCPAPVAIGPSVPARISLSLLPTLP